MDPNANLAEQRRIRTVLGVIGGDQRVEYLERLAELVEALDE